MGNSCQLFKNAVRGSSNFPADFSYESTYQNMAFINFQLVMCPTALVRSFQMLKNSQKRLFSKNSTGLQIWPISIFKRRFCFVFASTFRKKYLIWPDLHRAPLQGKIWTLNSVLFRLCSNAHHFMNYERILIFQVAFFLLDQELQFLFLKKLQPFKGRHFLEICQVGTYVKNFYMHQTLYKLSEKLVQT